MPEFLKKLQQKLLEFWGNLNKSQKIRLAITVAIILTAVIVSLVIVSKPNYITLIESEDPKQLKNITDSLTEQGIVYKMSDDGKKILINDKDKSAAQVASLSFVGSSMDFEDAYNMIKLNSTESDKQALWDQYKKENLSSKLEAIADNIEMADVVLDVPEKSPFVTSDDEEEKPTASVIVKTREELTDENVQAIAMMVAGSVSGLNYKDVVVLDDKLNILSKDNTDEGIGRLNSEEEMRLKKAEVLQKGIYTLYGGPTDSYDSIKVVANPYIDFDKSKSVTNDVQVPEGMDKTAGLGVKVSESVLTEKATGANDGGVVGTDANPGDANTPNYPIGDTGNGEYKKGTTQTNWDYIRKTIEEEKATGNLVPEKSSIALALYYGRKVTDDEKLSDEFINNMIQGVSSATGIPAQQISINKIKMPPLEESKTSASDFIKDLINDYGIFALMLILILGLILSLKPKKKKEEAKEEEMEEMPENVLLGHDEEPIQELDLEEKSEVKKQIDRFVKQKPDAVAQLLRNWLSDDWD